METGPNRLLGGGGEIDGEAIDALVVGAVVHAIEIRGVDLIAIDEVAAGGAAILDAGDLGFGGLHARGGIDGRVEVAIEVEDDLGDGADRGGVIEVTTAFGDRELVVFAVVEAAGREDEILIIGLLLVGAGEGTRHIRGGILGG